MRLIVVEDRFYFEKRGVVVLPALGHSQRVTQGERLELRRPDGSRVSAKASPTICFEGPIGAVLLFSDLTSDDVPIGTEVWSSEPDPQ